MHLATKQSETKDKKQNLYCIHQVNWEKDQTGFAKQYQILSLTQIADQKRKGQIQLGNSQDLSDMGIVFIHIIRKLASKLISKVYGI